VAKALLAPNRQTPSDPLRAAPPPLSGRDRKGARTTVFLSAKFLPFFFFTLVSTAHPNSFPRMWFFLPFISVVALVPRFPDGFFLGARL